MKQIKYIFSFVIILHFVFIISVLAEAIGQVNSESSIVEKDNNFNPHAVIKHTETYYMITMELIGIKRNDVLVEIMDEAHIIISGERKLLADDSENKDHERWYGAFTRNVTLSNDADMAMVTAKFRDGLLTIYVRRSAKEGNFEVARRIIEIK